MNNLINDENYTQILLDLKQRLALKQTEVGDADRSTY